MGLELLSWTTALIWGLMSVSILNIAVPFKFLVRDYNTYTQSSQVSQWHQWRRSCRRWLTLSFQRAVDTKALNGRFHCFAEVVLLIGQQNLTLLTCPRVAKPNRLYAGCQLLGHRFSLHALRTAN